MEQDALRTSLQEHAEQQHCTVADLTWEEGDKEFTVRIKVEFADQIGVQLGVTFSQIQGSPAEVQREMRRLLCLEIDKAGRAWQEHHESASVEETGPKAPADLTDCLVGFREWNVHEVAGGGYTLNPIGFTGATKGLWRPDGEWSEAVCGSSKANFGLPIAKHAAASTGDCHCGFNCWYEIGSMGSSGWPRVAGAMLGKGRVQVHGDGFRSQFARPLAFTYLQYHDKEKIVDLGEALGVPVIAPDDLHAMALEHGVLVPKNMRPG